MSAETIPPVGDDLRQRAYPAPNRPARPRSEPVYSVLNPAYPASYWQVAFSTDVAPGKAIPLHVLEREIVIWRDSRGGLHCNSAHCVHLGAHLGYGSEVVNDTLRCPFHAWQYDAVGKVVAMPGLGGVPKTRACLQVYRAYERYGTIFLWNGQSEPDHELPDLLGDAGLREDATDFEHTRFKLPFPSKWLRENVPDASHFGPVHGIGTWADAEIVRQTPTTLELILHFNGRSPYHTWADVKRNYRRGEMLGLFDVTAGDERSITYGGGLHLIQTTPPTQELTDRQNAVTKTIPRLAIAAGRVVSGVTDRTALALSFTPCDADSHILYTTIFLPHIKNPVLRALGKPVIKDLATRLYWFASSQDSAVMAHRREPEKPAYQRFDRGLVQFRKFLDDRIALASAGDANATPKRA
jgi:phenylpropionate dioxygenase-like ring-hydroxylating dioxygenase large terminal subunit